MFGTVGAPVDLLRLRAETTPQRPAVFDAGSGSEYSYRDLDIAVGELAGSLRSAVDAGEPTRLGVALSTRPGFVFAAHACMRLGWELVPLNARLAPDELATRLGRLEPAAILCGEETEATIDEALGTAPETVAGQLPPVLTVDDPVIESSRPLPDPDRRVCPDPHDPTDTALILFTSGTTGEPKGVRLTGRNLASSAIASAFRLGVTPSDRWLCCLPMYHMGGLAPAFRSVLYGTTLVLQREFDATGTAEMIADEGITGVSLVPTQLSRLLDAGLSGPGLRTILLGGAPATESLLDRADDAGLPVYPTYGLTETASQVATARPAETREHPGTVGQPLLGTTVRIVDDSEPVGSGERGEIVVDGPTVTPGYLDEARTEEAFSEYGLHTGDVGYRDEDGRLWVLGRIDDTIITGGELVAPAEVTEQLLAVPGVEDGAVVGIDDDEWGERIAALLVPGDDSPDCGTLRERVQAHCSETLADYKRPKTIVFVESIPRTHSGTVDRGRIRELLGRVADR